MFLLLVILFTVIPAFEIYLLIKVGGEFGIINTIWFVIATGVIGASLAKSQGLSIIQRIQKESQNGRIPGKEIIQGLMIFAGGLLLLTPGFITDIFGFCLVMPGPRHVLMIFVSKLVESAITNGNFQFQAQGFGASSMDSSPYEREQESDVRVSSDVFEAEYEIKEE